MIKTYQWIKGELAGKVVTWDNVSFYDEAMDMNFMVFQDGSRANASLLNDFFIEIHDANDLMLIPEIPQEPLPVEINPPLQRVKLESTPIVQKIEQTQSPMHVLLHESNKKTLTINTDIQVDIPPIELMKVLSSSYADGEQQVLNYITSTINIEDIKKQISKQIWLTISPPAPVIPKRQKTKV